MHTPTESGHLSNGQDESSKKLNTTPDLLNGPVASIFVRMSMPIILGLLVNGLFNFVDAIFISRAVGTQAIGGVSAAFPVHMMMISISAMLGSGMASILSRRLGAGLDAQANQVFSASMVLAGLVGLLVALVVVTFRYEIFTLTHLPTDLVPYAVEYITPIALFSVVSFLYGSLSEAFRAEGQNMQVMKLMAVSALLNIVLDALFLFVFQWGVAGAAWATVMAISVSFSYALVMLYGQKHRIKFEWEHFRFIKQVHKEALLLGIPVFLSYTGFAMMLLTVNIALVRVGGSDAQLLISAHGILNRTFMLIFLPVLGMMIAFQTFAGFNYGAQQYKRVAEVLKVALIFSSVYALFWSVVMIFKSHWLLQLFTSDQLLINAAVDISSIVFLCFITVGIGMICPALFQALGYAKPATILNSLHTYFLLIPLLWVCSGLYGLAGVWWAFPAVDLLSAIIIGFYTWRFIRRFSQGDASSFQ